MAGEGPRLVRTVHLVEDGVERLARRIEAERDDGLAELVPVHAARAVDVPLAEEVHHARERARERVAQ